MNKWLKWAGYGLLALVVASIPAYWWLFAESHRAPAGSFAIDIAEVRRLADAQPGEKPLLVRFETVAHVSPPRVFVVAGDSWHSIDLPISSYELIYQDHIAVLDTALNADVAKSMGATNFDSAAYARMSDALAHASLIVVTHEHPDHIGGLLAQPDLEKLLPTTRLTREEVAELKPNLGKDSFTPLHLPSTIFDGYQPLDYVRYFAPAPGGRAHQVAGPHAGQSDDLCSPRRWRGVPLPRRCRLDHAQCRDSARESAPGRLDR